MTPEQLDEIERLAEAATPGPWIARLTDRGHALWGPLPSGDCGSMRIALASYAAFDRANMLFVEGMRDAALPLVKALRAARAETDIAKAFHDVAVKERDYERVRGNRIEKERDEARAEAAEIRKKRNADLLALEKAMDASAEGSWLARALDAERERDEARAEVARMKARPAETEYSRLDGMWQQLVRERDESRAEVERLKESVANLDVLYVSRTDALRESEAEVERLRGIVEVNDRRLAAVWDESRAEARAKVARLQAQVEWLLEGREQQEQRLAVEVDE